MCISLAWNNEQILEEVLGRFEPMKLWRNFTWGHLPPETSRNTWFWPFFALLPIGLPRGWNLDFWKANLGSPKRDVSGAKRGISPSKISLKKHSSLKSSKKRGWRSRDGDTRTFPTESRGIQETSETLFPDINNHFLYICVRVESNKNTSPGLQ